MNTLSIPSKCYKYRGENVDQPRKYAYGFDYLDFEGPILLKMTEFDFPNRGHVEPEVMRGLNVCKAFLLHQLHFPAILSIFFRRKSFLYHTLRVLDHAMRPYILESKHMSDAGLEIKIAVETFLELIGLSVSDSVRVSEHFSHVIEYDNAYRLRIVDMFSEITRKELENQPIKTLNKLIAISKQRGTASVHKKFKKIIRLFQALLIVPFIKKAFKKTVGGMIFERVQYDDVDRYFACRRTDYLYMGKNPEERMQYAKNRGWKYGEPKEIT